MPNADRPTDIKANVGASLRREKGGGDRVSSTVMRLTGASWLALLDLGPSGPAPLVDELPEPRDRWVGFVGE